MSGFVSSTKAMGYSCQERLDVSKCQPVIEAVKVMKQGPTRGGMAANSIIALEEGSRHGQQTPEQC